MAVENIASIEELAETTGQSVEQLRKDREAVSEMTHGSNAEQ
jgi:predicted transcriptional regulator